MNTGKTIKDPNAQREVKVDQNVLTANSDVAKKAAKAAEADRKARAKAAGLKSDATIEEIADAEFEIKKKAFEEAAKAKEELKAKNHKLWMLSNHLEDMFEAREKTNLPKYTETEVLAAVGKLGSSANTTVEFTNEDKTKGFIQMEEHGMKVRVPSTGEFNFSFDFAKAAADLAKQNAAE